MGQDKIIVEGPPEEVHPAKKELEELTKDLVSCLFYCEWAVYSMLVTK